MCQSSYNIHEVDCHTTSNSMNTNIFSYNRYEKFIMASVIELIQIRDIGMARSVSATVLFDLLTIRMTVYLKRNSKLIERPAEAEGNFYQ